MTTTTPATTPTTTPKEKTGEKTALADSWRVVVLNDPVNLMSYVVLVFRKLFGFDETTARRHMLEVHERGRSVVWRGVREQAEAYAYALHEWHLTAILERNETD
ncbi:MAG: ATP-dependent Clp protease adaptor ClpS [Opitutaceae bacterium]|jgi:ATP-dependent Clp protease adaptor protein ClpS|nr:ATP-dependent Clp protease adaptor ClpS [Opitutaceae bacterium]